MVDTEDVPEFEPEIPPEYQAEVNTEDYNSEELEAPEWLTELDREILALLGNNFIIMTPSVIAKNLDRSRSSVSRRLNTLEAGGMVEKVERGHYQISGEGWARLVEKVPSEYLATGPEGFTAVKILTPEEHKRVEEAKEKEQ